MQQEIARSVTLQYAIVTWEHIQSQQFLKLQIGCIDIWRTQQTEQSNFE